MKLFGLGLVTSLGLAVGGVVMIAANGYNAASTEMWAAALAVARSDLTALVGAAMSGSLDSILYLGILITFAGLAAGFLLLSGWALTVVSGVVLDAIPSGSAGKRGRIAGHKPAADQAAEGGARSSDERAADIDLDGDSSAGDRRRARVMTVVAAGAAGLRRIAVAARNAIVRLELGARLGELVDRIRAARSTAKPRVAPAGFATTKSSAVGLNQDAVDALRTWYGSILRGVSDPIGKAAEAVEIARNLGPAERAFVIEGDAHNGELMLTHVDAWARKAGSGPIRVAPQRTPHDIEMIRRAVRETEDRRRTQIGAADPSPTPPQADAGVEEGADGFLNVLNDVDRLERELGTRDFAPEGTGSEHQDGGSRMAPVEAGRADNVADDVENNELGDVPAVSAFDDADAALIDEDEEAKDPGAASASGPEENAFGDHEAGFAGELEDAVRELSGMLLRADLVASGADEWEEEMQEAEARREAFGVHLADIEAIVDRERLDVVLEVAREHVGEPEWDWILANLTDLMANPDPFVARIDGRDDSIWSGEEEAEGDDETDIEDAFAAAPVGSRHVDHQDDADSREEMEDGDEERVEAAATTVAGLAPGLDESGALGRNLPSNEGQETPGEEAPSSAPNQGAPDSEGTCESTAGEASPEPSEQGSASAQRSAAIGELEELEASGDLIAQWSDVARRAGAREATVPKVLTRMDGKAFRTIGIIHAVFRWRNETSNEVTRINLILRHVPEGEWRIERDDGVRALSRDGSFVAVTPELLGHPEVASAKTLIHFWGPGSVQLAPGAESGLPAVVTAVMDDATFAAFLELP